MDYTLTIDIVKYEIYQYNANPLEYLLTDSIQNINSNALIIFQIRLKSFFSIHLAF